MTPAKHQSPKVHATSWGSSKVPATSWGSASPRMPPHKIWWGMGGTSDSKLRDPDTGVWTRLLHPGKNPWCNQPIKHPDYEKHSKSTMPVHVVNRVLTAAVSQKNYLLSCKDRDLKELKESVKDLEDQLATEKRLKEQLVFSQLMQKKREGVRDDACFHKEICGVCDNHISLDMYPCYTCASCFHCSSNCLQRHEDEYCNVTLYQLCRQTGSFNIRPNVK